MKGVAVIDLLILALLLGGIVRLSAQEADAKPDTEIVAEQYLLLGTATRGCDESQLAVNPLNHQLVHAKRNLCGDAACRIMETISSA